MNTEQRRAILDRKSSRAKKPSEVIQTQLRKKSSLNGPAKRINHQLKLKTTQIDKYDLYENSVQTPGVHIYWFAAMYKEIRNKEARHLREDFCGTFQLCWEWITMHPENSALGIDLDPEPLAYGRKKHFSSLTPDQKKRLTLLQANVLTPTTPKRDLIIACNFSFYIFKERKTLLQYFKTCLKSLKSDGVLILEMAGGPGMITKSKEQRTIKREDKSKFVYIWDQKSFDPITHDALYSIHFKLPSGEILKDVFVYDWRLWTIPEVKDLLMDAGFRKVHVYWETSHRGEGTGEYVQAEKGDNAFSWIAYIAASV